MNGELLSALGPLAALPALLAALPLTAIWLARGFSWRVAFLLASVAWGLLVTAFTEGLSIFCYLSSLELFLAWLVVCVTLAAIAARCSCFSAPGPGKADRLIVGLVAMQLAVVATLAVIAWLSAPNNWDSHTYHLARVQHWLQNRSVATYRTNIERQVEAGPWAEYALAHFQLLGGTDRLANFVQWYALLGSAIAVSVIAKALGANAPGQTAASAASVSLPMGILQASSTQNDYVASFWLVTFVALGLETLRGARLPQWSLVLATGAGLGLALLTKGTTYVYAPPFIVWFCTRLVRRIGLGGFPYLVVSGVMASIVVLPHWVRNTVASGSPLGPGYVMFHDARVAYGNESVTIGGTVSNVVRSMALQLGAPDFDHVFGVEAVDGHVRALAGITGSAPSARWNEFIIDSVRRLLHSLGLNPDDPATTWYSRSFHVPVSGWNFEDTAGNPVHVFAFGLAALLLLASSRRATREIWIFVACCACGFILFNAVFAWQVYHSRLHLPLFVLASAFFGAAVDRIGGRNLSVVLAGLMILLSTPWLLNNLMRPLFGPHSIVQVPRFDQYFRLYPDLKAEFVHAAELVKQAKCRSVNVSVDQDAWEYAFWAALAAADWRAHIQHVGVINYTSEIDPPHCTVAIPACVEVDISMSGVVVRSIAPAATVDRAMPLCAD